MKITTLLFQEMRHRYWSSIILVLLISIAVCASMSILLLLKDSEINNRHALQKKSDATKQRMQKMEDDYRKITKRMGFNILILPKEQDLGAYYADDDHSAYMPEQYVHTLAQSKIVTVQHLLPTLKQKLKWPEQKRSVLLIGVRDEVPLAHRDPKKPILHPVPPGHVTIGHELHNSLGIKKGDRLTFMNHQFTVHRCHQERGNKDDISIWFDLGDAQNLLQKPGLINGIMALECKCAFANLSKVRNEIQGILPDTQVIEFQSQALARAEARQTASQVAEAHIAAERQHAEQQNQERQRTGITVISLLSAATAIVLLLITMNQVRERRYEIGILRAIGLQHGRILLLFINKIILLSVLGTILGILISLSICAGHVQQPVSDLLSIKILGLFCTATPLLCLLTTWLPILSAAHYDVAHLLRAD